MKLPTSALLASFLLVATVMPPAALAHAPKRVHTVRPGADTARPPARQHFISALDTALRQQNRQILRDRQRLQVLAKRPSALRAGDRVWLHRLASAYGLRDTRDDQDLLQALLLRVDAVPSSLPVAQAILESGWGQAASTRRTANPFGMLCSHGCARRGRLMQFPNQQAAVAYYVRLLNTGKAYEPFRQLRAQARAHNQKLRGERLAEGLGRYSTQGRRYVSKVKNTIQVNRLASLD